MNKRARTRLFVVTVVILAIVGVLIYNSQRSGGLQYYKTVGEVMAEASELEGTNVRVAGRVRSGSIERNKEGLNFTVVETDTAGAAGIAVVYNGPPVETFKEGADVVIDGRYEEDGTIRSESMITKCPSKFEEEKKRSELEETG